MLPFWKALVSLNLPIQNLPLIAFLNYIKQISLVMDL